MYLTSKYVLVNKNTSLFQIKYSKKKKGKKSHFINSTGITPLVMGCVLAASTL